MTPEPGGKLTRQARQFVWAYQLGISTFVAFLRGGIGRFGWMFVLALAVLLADALISGSVEQSLSQGLSRLFLSMNVGASSGLKERSANGRGQASAARCNMWRSSGWVRSCRRATFIQQVLVNPTLLTLLR
jgi:hypothetical protein